MNQTTSAQDPHRTAGPSRPPLRRSRTNRKVSGVAGGLGRHLGVDPLLVRVGFVVLTVCGAGIGLFLYVIALLLIPDERSADRPGSALVDRHGRLLAVVAAVLIAFALLGGAGPFGWGPDAGPWALVVLAVVGAVLWTARRDAQQPAPGTAGPWSGPGAWSGQGSQGQGSWQGQGAWQGQSASAAQGWSAQRTDVLSTGGEPYGPTSTGPTEEQAGYGAGAAATAEQPPGQAGGTYPGSAGPGATGGASYGYYDRPTAGEAGGPPRDPQWTEWTGFGGEGDGWTGADDSDPADRSSLGLITVSAAALVAGILITLSRVTEVSVPATVVLASSLAVVALGLIVGTFVGRSRGLVGWAVLLTVATAFSSVAYFPSGQVGDVEWRPASVTEVAAEHKWGVGNATLDLTAVSSATPVTTRAALGVGELKIHVPADAVVELTAHVGAGEIATPARLVERSRGRTYWEMDLVDGVNRDSNVTLHPAPSDATGGASGDDTAGSTGTTFRLDARVGLGTVEVLRETP